MAPELFFGPAREPTNDRVAREEAAKAVCAACPARASCLAAALRRREPAGVWGGLSESERNQLLVAGRP